MTLAMTENEIISKWNRSDKKKSDLRIIAELNDVTEDVIKKIIEVKEFEKEVDEEIPVEEVENPQVPAKATKLFNEMMIKSLEHIENELNELEKRKEELEQTYKQLADCWSGLQ